MRGRFHTVCICGLAFTGSHAAAQLHTSDIALKLENGQLVTGRIEVGSPAFPHQVFPSVLGIYGIPGATFDPGFDSETGALPANTLIGLTVRRALRKWDGAGFGIIPAERLEIIRSVTAVTPSVDPANCGVGESVGLGLTTPTGRIHQHPAYQLLAPASDGVYLLELEAWFGEPSQGISEPFFIVFANNVSPSEHLEAVEWVEQFMSLSCWANCDGSTTYPLLTVDDFTCFIDKFAHGDCYANCDRRTTPPIFTVDDFTCFIDRFAQGCP